MSSIEDISFWKWVWAILAVPLGVIWRKLNRVDKDVRGIENRLNSDYFTKPESRVEIDREMKHVHDKLATMHEDIKDIKKSI